MLLPRLRRQYRRILSRRNKLNILHRRPLHRLRQGRGKRRSKQIDVQLQIAAAITAIDRQPSAMPVPRADQVETQAPRIPRIRLGETPRLAPAQMRQILRLYQMKSAIDNFRPQFKGIEIVGIEGSSK